MSVIQKIRDKYARWAVIAIALSLLGFILMDAFNGRSGFLNNGPSNTIGKVNGKTIDRVEFEKIVQQYVSQYGEESRPQIVNFVWEQEVANVLVEGQAEKLGLQVTDKEMKDVLYGDNPPQWLAKAFTDQQTGKYDAISAQQQVNQILKKGPGAQGYDFVQSNIEQTKDQRLITKYMNLMMGSIYFSKWFLEKRNVDNSYAANVSYVSVPYVSIPDSTVKISDDEIRDYMNAHEDEFKREKESRSIQYVLFSTAPTAADSTAAKNEVENLKSQFASAQDPSLFIRQHNGTMQYDTTYHGKSTIQVPAKDSIFNTPVGSIYGPYLDGNAYVMAKVMGVKSLPDTVKARHILIGTVNPQTGQPTLSDSLAKKRADSIAAAIQAGANFDSLVVKFSDDEGSKANGGVYTLPSSEIQSRFVKEFGDFILFEGQPGSKKVVKTQFGYHYIEVMKHINVEPHYRVAYFSRPIVASQETDDAARNAANMFAGDSRDINAFNTNFEKNLKAKGYNKQFATDMDPLDFGLMGVPGSARSFVKKVFEADKGDVIGPEQLQDNYIVAVITEVNKAGLPSVSSIRPQIETLLRNKKKGDMIIKNIGQITSLEQVAQKTGQQIQRADSLRFSGGQMLGYEPKVLGAVFNPANKGKVVNQPIKGVAGVYVISVENVYTTPVESANIEEQRKNYEMQMRQGLMNQMQQGGNPIVEPLKRAAKIKDNRASFY